MTISCSKCGYTRPDDVKDIGIECPVCGEKYPKDTKQDSTTESGRTETNTPQTQPSPVKHITVNLVLSWIFGVLFLILGVGNLFENYLFIGIALILISAILLPPSINSIEDKFHFKLSRNIKVIIIAILLLGGIGLTDKSQKTETNISVSHPPPITTKNTIKAPVVKTTKPEKNKTISKKTILKKPENGLTARELYKEFDDNEIAAEARYKKKNIVITGIVDKVKNNVAGQPIINIDAGTLKYISCRFPKSSTNQLINIQNGKQITLSCIVDYKMLTTIHLFNCSIHE